MTDVQTETKPADPVAVEPPAQLPAVPDKHAAAVEKAEKRARKPAPVTSLRNIATALAAVTAEVGVVSKQGYNKFHGYKYAAMQDVLQKLAPLIGKHGLIIMQTETEDGRKFIDDSRAVAVEYEFTIAHSSGEVWPDRPRQTGLCKCRDSKGGFDDKAFNKCHTAARKYFLLSLFQIATGEEEDADKEQTGTARRAPQPAPNVVLHEPSYPPHDPQTGEIFDEVFKENRELPADDQAAGAPAAAQSQQTQPRPAADPIDELTVGKQAATSPTVPAGVPSVPQEAPAGVKITSEQIRECEGQLTHAAKIGLVPLQRAYKGMLPGVQQILRVATRSRHIRTAAQVDGLSMNDLKIWLEANWPEVLDK